MIDNDDLAVRLRSALLRTERQAPVGSVESIARATASVRQTLGWRTTAFSVIPYAAQSLVIGAFAVLAFLLIQGAGSSRPHTGTASMGGFELTIRADRATYGPDDPMQVTAMLKLTGSETERVISSSEPLIGFGVANDSKGVSISPVVRDRCIRTTLSLGGALELPFRKSGFIKPDDPNVDLVRAYFAERDRLTLPRGTWRIYARSQFWASPDCSGQPIDLRAEVTIKVF